MQTADTKTLPSAATRGRRRSAEKTSQAPLSHRAQFEKMALWFIPDALKQGDADTLRRAKLVVLFCFALMFWGPVYSLIYFFYLNLPDGAFVIASATVLVLCLPLLLRQTGRMALVGNLLTFILSFVLSYTAYVSGGHGSPPLWWKSAVPMFALCLVGLRSGCTWAVLSLFEVIAYYALDRMGYSSPYSLLEDRQKFLEMSVLSGLLILIFSLSYIYETLKSQMQSALEKNAREIARAKDAAEAASRAKSIFLANMSHELRTPLHGILSYASFGRKEVHSASPEKMAGYFQQILDSSHRLLGLLNNLLDLSKLEANKMQYRWKNNDLRLAVELVLSEFRVLAKERRIALEFEPASPSIVGVFDEERIVQVIRNLVSNAIKFSDSGTKVRIEAGFDSIADDKRGEIPALYLSVLNRGIGIPEPELETIFDKFVQSSKTRSGSGGTGLGLAICREIITAHGGKIVARNDMAGTRFTFRIPIGSSDVREVA